MDCDYCNAEICLKANFKRHLIDFHSETLNKKQIKTIIDKKFGKKQRKKCNMCKKEYVNTHKCKKKQVNAYEIMEIIEKSKTNNDLNKLRNQLINVINKNIDNKIINNTLVNDNSKNIIINGPVNITFQIRNFGDENLEALKDPEVFKLLYQNIEKHAIKDKEGNIINYDKKASQSGMIRILDGLHNNEKYPENKNIRSGKNENEFYICVDNVWSPCTINKVGVQFEKIRCRTVGILYEKFEETTDIEKKKEIKSCLTLLSKKINFNDENGYDIIGHMYAITDPYENDIELSEDDLEERWTPKNTSDTEPSDNKSEEDDLSYEEEIPPKEIKTISKFTMKKRK